MFEVGRIALATRDGRARDASFPLRQSRAGDVAIETQFLSGHF
jgi:hypothetical protein